MSEITGFIQDPLEPITRLRNDLGDRYKQGFPFLKELIQNADDARASHVIFGLAPSVAGATHPLLKGRGLFVINNGVFKAKHERGIRLYGTSNKVADTAAVGKFGLGMKSVFHLCEAFLFLAHVQDRGSRAGIVNPWSVPDNLSGMFKPVHPGWGPLTEADAELMRAALAPVTADLPAPFAKAPFVLWLPLRCDAHRWEDGVETGVIVSEFPGDSDRYLAFLNESSLQTQLADLLPLLRHVQQIRFHPSIQDPQSTLFSEVLDGAQRLRFAKEIPENPISGGIRVRRSGTDIAEVGFAGRESYQWTNELRTLSKGPHWPQNNTTDEQGLVQVEPDKAQPHAAAVLTNAPAESGSGHLTLRWAVFLPLDESLVSETLDCGGEQDYCCTLHGYFFVDAGRRGIHGFDVLGKGGTDAPVDSVDAVRIGWNRELATNGTLPLLLPVLQEHISGLRVADRINTGRRLATAILKSTLWKEFGQEITATCQWVLELSPGGSSWKLIVPDRELLPLPTPPEHDPQRPWQVFPILSELQTTHALVVSGAPQLSTSPANSPDQEQLELLLGSVTVADAMGKQTHIAYIAATLRLCAEQSIQQPRVQTHLCRLLREGFRQVHLRGIRANRKDFSQLTSLLPSDGYLTLPESLPDDLLEQLACCDLEPLLLPADLAPRNEQPTAKLSVAEATRLLRLIADWIRAESSRGRNKLVLEQVPRLVRHVNDASRAAVFRSVWDQDLIYAYDGVVHDWRAVSPETVGKAKQANLLFRMGQVGDEQGLGLAKKLQAALADGRVLVLRRETREMLDLPESQVPVCDAKGVLQTLGTQSQSLKEPIARQGLVRQLPDPGEDAASRRGLRFLLHGYHGRWSDLDTTLWYRDMEHGTAWERLWRQLNEGWNLVDQQIAVYVSDPIKNSIGVKRIRPAELLEAISREGAAKIDPAAYTAEECTEILSQAHDEEVWRMLPLHEYTDDSRGDALGAHVFLDTTGLPLPSGLDAHVRVIRCSRDENLVRRQRQLLNPFDSEVRLRLTLASARPDRFAGVILYDVESLTGQLPSDIQENLADSAWVSDDRDGIYRLTEVIDCEDPSGLIRDLAARVPAGAYTFVDLVSAPVLEHPGFKLLRKQGFLAQGESALETLGMLIAEFPEYRLGAIAFDDESLPMALPVLAGMPDHLGLPGWALLESLSGDHDAAQVTSLVAREMAVATDDEMETVVGVLDWIRRQGQADEARRAAFELYLKRFAALPNAAARLGELHLIDSGGHWRSAGELCAGVKDIERRFVLRESQQRILQRHLYAADKLVEAHANTSPQTPPVEGEALASLLEDYFRDWRDKVPEALIGCFVFLCGSAPEVKALIETYRGNRVGLREWLLAKFPWKVPGLRNDGVQEWLHGMNLGDAIDTFRFSAAIAADSRVTVCSIMGAPLVVQRALNPTTFVTVLGNDTEVILQLVPVDVGSQTAAALSELLRSSIQELVRSWSGQQPNVISAIWDEIESSDQVAVDVARTLILESLPILSTQLKSNRHAELDRTLRAYDDARAKVVEFSGHERVAEFEEQKRQALANVRALIEQDAGARSGLLGAVREKIRDYQYKIGSIPFELFQNADDALCERIEIEDYQHGPGTSQVQLDPGLARFVIQPEQNALTFLHWGRPINAIGDPFPGRERGYHRDLEKMLIINASDKERPATGKFGLGFKSVFLACDQPQLVSGRLSVEILGGMLPMQLAGDSGLRNLLRNHESIPGSSGTAIRIDTADDNQNAVLGRFRAMAGVLCCFSKAIRRVDLIGESDYAWDPMPLDFAPALSVGRVTVPQASGGSARIRAMRMELDDGALLVGLAGAGIESLPSSVPTLWIMAPTAEDDALGFALNGPFDVDAGRTRLADSDDSNLNTADRLGRGFYEALDALVGGIERDWDEVNRLLSLNEDVAPYDFWHSLWKTLLGGLQVRDLTRVRALALRVMQSGVGNLASVRSIVPNGLPSQYRRLLCTEDVRLVLRGALGIPTVLETLVTWDSFESRLNPAQTLRADIHEWVALADPKYGSARGKWTSKKLVDFVALLMDGKKQLVVTPEAARVWGRIFAISERERLPKDQRDDLDEAEKLFNGASFRSAKGGVSPAAELLDGNADDEERMRWAFAPENRRLSPEYDEIARGLLRRCRTTTGFAAGSQQLAEWIRSLADDLARRSAALRYLRDGKLAADVIALLREQELEGTWFARLDKTSDYFSGWEIDQILLLLTKFQSVERLDEIISGPEIKVEEEDFPVDVTATLARIRDWWSDKRASLIQDYEAEVYPGGSAPAAELRFEHEVDFTGDRSAWLTLFLLGHFHTIGLVGSAQNRGFIQMCRQRGWWQDVFSMTNPSQRPDDWMRVLDEYIDAQTGAQIYEHWMQRFPAIYRLARYLEDYRELMLGLPDWNWPEGQCHLDQVTRPRMARRLQGGGVSAPPFHRTLGIGACFVVRELLRLGVVTGERAPHACAYVPTKGVRRLFTRWGYPEFDGANADVGLSKVIHKILVENMGDEDARFQGDYDIPLQLIAYNEGHRAHVTVCQS